MILYNYFENGQSQNVKTLLGIISAIKEIITRKKLLDYKNVYNWNNLKFKDHVLWIIKTKIKEFQNDELLKSS